jgi:hypothetical protein
MVSEQRVNKKKYIKEKRKLTKPVNMSSTLNPKRNSAMHGAIQWTLVKGAVQAKRKRDLWLCVRARRKQILG